MRLTRDGYTGPENESGQPVSVHEAAWFLAEFHNHTNRVVVTVNGVDLDIRGLAYSREDDVIRLEVGEYRPSA